MSVFPQYLLMIINRLKYPLCCRDALRAAAEECDDDDDESEGVDVTGLFCY